MTRPAIETTALSESELNSRQWGFVSPRYRIADLDIGIRRDDSEAGAFLGELLEPFRAAGAPTEWYSVVDIPAAPEEAHAVYVGDQRLLFSSDRDRMTDILLWHLNQRVMAETRSSVAVHAGVVSLNGRGVVIPGDADAGKSTLVAALVADGFDYLSDEGAMLDLVTGEVCPYPRAISLQPGSWPLVPDVRPHDHPGYRATRQWYVQPTSIRPDVIGPRCSVAAIVVPQRTPGTAAALRPLGRAATVRLLAKRATNLGDLGEKGFHALVTAVRDARCGQLELDGVDSAVTLVRTLVTERVDNFQFRTHREAATVWAVGASEADDDHG